MLDWNTPPTPAERAVITEMKALGKVPTVQGVHRILEMTRTGNSVQIVHLAIDSLRLMIVRHRVAIGSGVAGAMLAAVAELSGRDDLDPGTLSTRDQLAAAAASLTATRGSA